MDQFAGKLAVITGAASGLGRAFTERFATEGMKVVLVDIEAPVLDATVEELRAAGLEVSGTVADVSNAEAMGDLAARIAAEHGPVHLLCNNAGVDGYLGPVWEASARDWQWTFGVNFWGIVNGVTSFLPGMLAHGEYAHIVNTASAAGLSPARSIYGVTKHAVVAFSESVLTGLTRQNAQVGISVLCPGTVNTNLFYGARNRPAELRNPDDGSGVEDAAEFREAVRAQMKQGPAPSETAEILFQAIKDGRFYILTDDETPRLVQARSEAIQSQGTLPLR